MAFPNKVYALLRNLVYMEIEGAASVTLDDAGNVIEVYDLETHRDLLDAGSIGRAWSEIGGSYASPPNPGTTVPESEDDRLQHVAPRFTLKQRTMLIWWSGAAGTGDKLAMCWSDQFIGYSGSPPKFVQ